MRASPEVKRVLLKWARTLPEALAKAGSWASRIEGEAEALACVGAATCARASADTPPAERRASDPATASAAVTNFARANISLIVKAARE